MYGIVEYFPRAAVMYKYKYINTNTKNVFKKKNIAIDLSLLII